LADCEVWTCFFFFLCRRFSNREISAFYSTRYLFGSKYENGGGVSPSSLW
jgi:hypothetical protein